MKILKKLLGLILAFIITFNPIFNIYAQETGTNQIKYVGGEASADGVKISKTISKSNLENYFDITLTVETTSKIEEITKAQDLAVVLVMDISNTMNYAITSDKDVVEESRLDVAKKSVNEFISTFYDYSKGSNAVRQIGLVTFNRDSYDVFGGLQNVNTVPESNLTGKDGKVNKITAPTDVDIKWTNMEAGLKKANDTLGHSAGDELICAASNCMKFAFASYGKIYRIGGDEFCVILRDEKQERACTEAFCRLLEEKRRKNPNLPTVSYGSAAMNIEQDILTTKDLADQNMYQFKKARKALQDKLK